MFQKNEHTAHHEKLAAGIISCCGFGVSALAAPFISIQNTKANTIAADRNIRKIGPSRRFKILNHSNTGISTLCEKYSAV